MKAIGWGILGSGAIAGLFAEGLGFAPGARLAAVGSRSEASAAEFAARFGFSRAHGSYEALVADPAVDVVYVATPNHLHKEHALLALGAGKAVLVEKPFTLNAAEAAEVAGEAGRRRLFCMEAMWMRFAPAVRALQAQLGKGDLGEPRLLTAQLGFPYAYDPANRVFATPGGGALLDLGVYPLSLAVLLFGRPDRIEAQTVLAPNGVDEQFSALLRFSGGLQAAVAASLRSALSNDAFLSGTAGTARLAAPLYFPQALSLCATPQHQPMRRGGASRLARLKRHPWARAVAELRNRARAQTQTLRPRGNGYEVQALEVMRCLREGALESPQMPLRQTLQVMELADEIRRQAPGAR
jgi:predicted dehydrogenase